MIKRFLIAPAALILFLCGCGANAIDTETSSNDKASSEATETNTSANENEESSGAKDYGREGSIDPKDFFMTEEESAETPESESPLDEEGTDVLQSEASSAEPVDGKVTFENVTFDLPSDYIFLGEMEEMGIPVVGYQSESNVISVVAEDISTFPELTMEEYVELAKQQTGYEYTSDETYEINGMETNELISKMDGFTLQQNTIIHDGTAYIFSFNTLDEDFEQEKEVFQSVLQSISFDIGSTI